MILHKLHSAASHERKEPRKKKEPIKNEIKRSRVNLDVYKTKNKVKIKNKLKIKRSKDN